MTNTTLALKTITQLLAKIADNLSDDEDKQKHNVVNNAQLFFKSIKDKFKRCKSSMYKSKQRISSMDYKNPQNSTAENASSESNVLAQHESENLSSPPPVPIRILSNETDRNYTGRNLHLPAAYVDISEILQTVCVPHKEQQFLHTNLILEQLGTIQPQRVFKQLNARGRFLKQLFLRDY